MAFIFATSYEYDYNGYVIDVNDTVKRFPFLQNKVVIGELLATYVDKVVKIKKPFKCKIYKEAGGTYRWLATIDAPNPMKEKGIQPCQVYLAFYKYLDTEGKSGLKEFPIMEDQVVKTYTGLFDEIGREISDKEEIRVTIESTTFCAELLGLNETLCEAYTSFEEKRYADTKTACRKILEEIRNKCEDWQTINKAKAYAKNSKICYINHSHLLLMEAHMRELIH